jgi:hypothetical protein
MSTQKTFAAGGRVNLGEELPPKAAPLKTNTQSKCPKANVRVITANVQYSR